MLDHDAIRNWSWWRSEDWGEYCGAYDGSHAHRPVLGQSFVVDLNESKPSKGHQAAIKKEFAAQGSIRPPRLGADVKELHEAHTRAAGRETRSQATWDLMEQWVWGGKAMCCTTGGDRWAYVIVEPPGAYYASGCGKDCHWLIWDIVMGLRHDDMQWLELGEGHTPGIDTFKKGFGGVLID